MEPKIVGVQTILTCSPDRRHYKEFVKLAATKLYMPVWNLEEVLSVGAHIHCHTSDKFQQDALKPDKIEERFYRFRGILRYVIPTKATVVKEAENSMEEALVGAKPVDTFIRGTNIERKDNISHFLLQYDVVCNGSFQHFQMMYASVYVKKCIEKKRANLSFMLLSIN